jgi:hypothetical protein
MGRSGVHPFGEVCQAVQGLHLFTSEEVREFFKTLDKDGVIVIVDKCVHLIV